MQMAADDIQHNLSKHNIDKNVCQTMVLLLFWGCKNGVQQKFKPNVLIDKQFVPLLTLSEELIWVTKFTSVPISQSTTHLAKSVTLTLSDRWAKES